MSKDEEIPLEADMKQDISNAILIAHQKMTGLVEDATIFFSEAKAGFVVDEGLVGGVILIGLFVGVIETLWWRKRRRQNSGLGQQVGCHHEVDRAKTVDDLNSRSRRVVEEASDLEEIRSALQNELNQSVERRVEGVRARISSRKEEMQQRLAAAEVFSIFFLHFD